MIKSQLCLALARLSERGSSALHAHTAELDKTKLHGCFGRFVFAEPGTDFRA